MNSLTNSVPSSTTSPTDSGRQLKTEAARRVELEESEPSQQLKSSFGSAAELETAISHCQRILDVELPAVIEKNSAGEDTVYVVLPIQGNFYIDKLSSMDLLQRHRSASSPTPSTPKFAQL